MSARRNVVLVAQREFVERFRDRTFLVSTIVVIVILLLITGLPRLLGADDPPDYTVGLTGQGSAPFAEPLRRGAGTIDARITIRDLGDAAAAGEAVRDGDVDLAVLDGGGLETGDDPPAPLVTLAQSVSAGLRARQALQDAGVEPGVIDRVLRPAPLPLRRLAPRGDPLKENIARFGAVLLYFQLLSYGFWVASGVVEEKSSRVVELLLAAVRPTHLLAGKVAGIGLLGLVQLAILAACGLGAAVGLQALDLRVDLLGTIGTVVLWFLLGYAFWVCAFAVAGAIVSRQEELQNTTTPLTMLMVGAFVLSIIAGQDPGSRLATACSLLPPVAPLIMPLRIAAGQAPAWQVVASIALTVGATAVLVPLAARIYTGALLRMGRRVKLREAMRAS